MIEAMVLSVVMPVYNEVATIGRVIAEVAAAVPTVEKQIVVIDDGSHDGSAEWLRRNLAAADGLWREVALGVDGALRLARDGAAGIAGFSFTILFHDRNRGKGAALRTGFSAVEGDVVVIQDADLEYDPHDWAHMLPLIVDRGVADVVYGSRFFGLPHRSLYYHHYLGNRMISILFNILYNQMLSDIEVCYKMMRREVLNELQLSANDFGVEIEISAQITRARRWRIYETAISYYGRTYDEGKKINWRDGLKGLFYLFKFRFTSLGFSRGASAP